MIKDNTNLPSTIFVEFHDGDEDDVNIATDKIVLAFKTENSKDNKAMSVD